MRVDVGDLASKGVARVRSGGHHRCLTFANIGNLVFIDLDLGPDAGMVGDRVNVCVRAHIHVGIGISHGDVAADGRMDDQALLDSIGSLELANLLVRDIEELESAVRNVIAFLDSRIGLHGETAHVRPWSKVNTKITALLGLSSDQGRELRVLDRAERRLLVSETVSK